MEEDEENDEGGGGDNGEGGEGHVDPFSRRELFQGTPLAAAIRLRSGGGDVYAFLDRFELGESGGIRLKKIR